MKKTRINKKQAVLVSFLIFFAGIVCACSDVFASSLYISNIVSEYDGTSDNTTVQFDISWSNAWRNTTNHDAVWVFVKYRASATGTWTHALMTSSGTNPTGFSAGTNDDADVDLEIIVPSDRAGCFLQSDDVLVEGAGFVSVDDVEIVVTGPNADDSIQVFGIEMVYIPEGGYFAGDGVATSSFISAYSTTSPWYISSEDQIATESYGIYYSSGYYYQSDGSDGDDLNNAEFIIPDSFPKGYGAFYLMKYEISQGTYRDFLNSLTALQKSRRVEATLSGNDENTYVMVSEATVGVTYRQTIKALPPAQGGSDYTFICDYDNDNIGNESTDGEWIAMNLMYWADLCAFADWAGLRPMTELEFEKACRGADVYPVQNEMAWGTADCAQANSAQTNEGQNTETPTNVGTAYIGLYTTGAAPAYGPFRSGFAASSGTTRVTAGAGYYGVTELGGNVYEQTVCVGHTKGRDFQGTHGDGSLSSDGDATNSDWPGFDGTSVSTAGTWGFGVRGGSFAGTASRMTISDREEACWSYPANRDSVFDAGGRLARTAP